MFSTSCLLVSSRPTFLFSNASFNLQKELGKFSLDQAGSFCAEQKIEFYNDAVRKVAVTLAWNTSRSMPSLFQEHLRDRIDSDGFVGAITDFVSFMEGPLGISLCACMDPRISVAWCKKVDLELSTIIPTTIQSGFLWFFLAVFGHSLPWVALACPCLLSPRLGCFWLMLEITKQSSEPGQSNS